MDKNTNFVKRNKRLGKKVAHESGMCKTWGYNQWLLWPITSDLCIIICQKADSAETELVNLQMFLHLHKSKQKIKHHGQESSGH